ncbi:hypothetical protein [Bacillus sp. B15-48]|nr:hypothetical protein [Bacillus sp. B15-48]
MKQQNRPGVSSVFRPDQEDSRVILRKYLDCLFYEGLGGREP